MGMSIQDTKLLNTAKYLRYSKNYFKRYKTKTFSVLEKVKLYFIKHISI